MTLFNRLFLSGDKGKQEIPGNKDSGLEMSPHFTSAFLILRKLLKYIIFYYIQRKCTLLTKYQFPNCILFQGGLLQEPCTIL